MISFDGDQTDTNMFFHRAKLTNEGAELVNLSYLKLMLYSMFTHPQLLNPSYYKVQLQPIGGASNS